MKRMIVLLLWLSLSKLSVAGGIQYGVQTHFGQFRRADMDSTHMVAMLDSVRAAGITIIRDECYWSDVEMDSGVYSFPREIDRYIEAALERDIKILLILNYNNPNYAPHAGSGIISQENREAFARYCAAVVQRYAPIGILHYEIWNEPNIPIFWDPLPDAGEYAELLKTVYPAIKNVDSTVTVLGCATSPAEGNPSPFIDWLTFIDGVFDAGAGAFMDALSFHLYRFGTGPESWLEDDIYSLYLTIDTDIPLWITEIGYPTSSVWPAVPLEDQANYLPRLFLLAQTHLPLKAIVYYDLKNDGENPAENEHNFGLLNYDLSPKPAYESYKMLTSMIGSKSFIWGSYNSTSFSYWYADDTDTVGAAWRASGTGTYECAIRSGRHLVRGRDGDTLYYTFNRDWDMDLQISQKPIYISRVESFPPIQELILSVPVDTVVAGQSFSLNAEAVTLDGNRILIDDGTCLDWEISNTSLASINDAGNFTALSAGDVILTVGFEEFEMHFSVTILDSYKYMEIEPFNSLDQLNSTFENMLPETQIYLSETEFTSAPTSLGIGYELKYIGSRSHRISLECDHLFYGMPDSLIIDICNDANPHYIKYEIEDRNGLTSTFQTPKFSLTEGWASVSIPLSDLDAESGFPFRLKNVLLYLAISEGKRDSLYTGTLFIDNLRLRGHVTTGIQQMERGSPARFNLFQNYPNPFNPETTIRYWLPYSSDVELTIYTILGQKINTLVTERQSAGYHTVSWNAAAYPSGVYFCRLSIKNQTAGTGLLTRKMVLLH